MPRLWRTGVVAVLVVLVSVLALTSLAAGKGTKGGTVIELVSGPPNAEEIDVGEPGPSTGDMVIGRADVFNLANKKVGFARFTCISNVGAGVMCTNHLTLFKRGQIVSQQSNNQTRGPVVVQSITGGTGEFRNARGQVRADFSEGLRLTYRVIG